eukprot:6110622-Heterocapsa_arctica.AAC.1
MSFLAPASTPLLLRRGDGFFWRIQKTLIPRLSMLIRCGTCGYARRDSASTDTTPPKLLPATFLLRPWTLCSGSFLLGSVVWWPPADVPHRLGISICRASAA